MPRAIPASATIRAAHPSDEVETLAIERAKQLFDCGFANVQPHSGAQANGAVMLALTKPGDTILGLSLDAGGHLTHGAKAAMSGKWFNAVQYGVRRRRPPDRLRQVEALASEHKPKLIIAGGSAYPRHIDFARFRAIADEVGALASWSTWRISPASSPAALHPTPFGHAHVVTTTTHKTLRGPRGGMILTDDEAIAKKINSAVFPGLQGGPLMHVIAAKAVAFGEALRPEFKAYAARGGRECQGARRAPQGARRATSSRAAPTRTSRWSTCARSASPARMPTRRSSAPASPATRTASPSTRCRRSRPAGIRVGSPAGTTRGFGIAEFREIGDMIADVLDGLRQKGEHGDPAVGGGRPHPRPRAVRALPDLHGGLTHCVARSADMKTAR